MGKTCRLCGVHKPLAEYHRASTSKDGHRGECKDCFRAQAAARYRADPERVKSRVRRWQQENPQRVRETRAAYIADGRKSENDRRSYLKRKFGITPEQYAEMLAAQGGVCALCSRPPRNDISLHVDHDHRTGAIRKLLCFRCNNALGDLYDDPELLRAAADYLDAHDPDVQEMAARARARLAALRA
jgi:hypothetical protein